MKTAKLSFVLCAFTFSLFGAKQKDACQLPLLGRRQIMNSHFQPQGSSIKIAFLDADDTLRVSISGRPSPEGPADVKLLPHIASKIKELNEQNYFVVIVSNQGGVSVGHNDLHSVDLALLETIRLLGSKGGRIDYYDFAERYDHNRKPQLGMIHTLQAILKAQFGENTSIDFAQSLMVGNSAYTKDDIRPDGQVGSDHSNSDRLFAENAKMNFFEAKNFFKPKKKEAPQQTSKDPQTPQQTKADGKKGGRRFAPLSAEDLKEKILEALRKKTGDSETTELAQYELLNLSPEISNDLKVQFDGENIDADPLSNTLQGFHTLENGLSFLGVAAGGDWQIPVFFIIYWDGSKLRAYVPKEGNPWNTDTHSAYGDDDDLDNKNVKKRYPELFKGQDGDYTMLRPEYDLIKKDILSRIHGAEPGT